MKFQLINSEKNSWISLSPLDLPSVSKYKAANDTVKPRVGLFWSKVGKIRTLDG